MPKNLSLNQSNRLWVWDRIPVHYIHQDNMTCYMKTGAFSRVVELSGKNFSGLTNEEKESLFNERKNMFMNVDDDFDITIIYDRKKVVKRSNEEHFTNIFAEELFKKQSDKIKESYRTRIFIVITKKMEKKTSNHFVIEDMFRKSYDDLNVKTNHIKAMLKHYDAKVLKKDEGDYTLMDFWSDRINIGKTIVKPKQHYNLEYLFAITNIKFDDETGLITLNESGKKRYASILRINTYPDETSQEMLDVLSTVRKNFSIVQNVKMHNDSKYLDYLEKEYNKYESIMNWPAMKWLGESRFVPKIMDIGRAKEDLAEGTTRFLTHQMMIIVYADSIAELEHAENDLKQTLSSSSISINAVKETLNLENAFWSQFPTYSELNSARNFDMSVHDLSNFASFSSASEGYTKSAFGNKPVMTFLTPEETAYNFIFHENDAPEVQGNTAIIAPTGGGKSTLMMALVANCLRFGGDDVYGGKFKALLFDIRNGLKSQVRCFGGVHIDLSTPNNLPMNPFLMEDTTENISFLIRWVSLLLEGDVTPKEQNLLERYVKAIMTMPKSERNLASTEDLLINFEPEEGRSSLYERLKKWIPNENEEQSSIYANYFNAKTDALSFDKQLVCFEMGYAIDHNPDLIPPIFAYISYCFSQSLKKEHSPHMVFIDEAKSYLQNQEAGVFIEDMILKIRKEGGIVCMASQSPEHIMKAGVNKQGKEIGKSISENLATKIIFPSSDANIESLKEFGLNHNEIQWILDNDGKRQVMIKKKGQQSVIINVDFADYGEHLHLITGNSMDSQMLTQLEFEISDYEKRIREYIKRKEKRFKARI